MRRLLAGMLLALLPSLALGQAATIANGACRLDGVDCGVTASGVATAGTIAVWGSGPALGSFDWLTATDATKTVALPKGTLNASLLKATALSTPGSITVTPVLSKVASITTVAGAALVDGDYLTVEYDTGLTVPIEFDASPGDGTTGGRVAYVFGAGDSADDIRDGLITLLNAAAGASLTASSGGAATVAIVLDTPGATGGTNSENVTDAGFAVTGFSNPTAATTVTYKLVAHLADGTSTEAGAASSTSASMATLSAANFLRLAWSAVTNAAYYSVWRTVSPTSPATTGKIVASTTALTLDDTGLAGGGETAPTTGSTGRLVSTALTSGRVALVGTGGQIQDDAGLTYSGTGATLAVSVPTIGMIQASYPATWISAGTGANQLAALKRWGGYDYGFVTNYGGGLYLPSAGTATWTATDFGDGTPDTSLSRISAGVIGVGTGAAGSIDGELSASTLWLRGGASGARIWLQAGIPGDAYFTLGGTGGVSALQNRMAMSSGAITVGDTGYYGFTNNYYSYQLDPDTILSRRAAATLQLGAADSATPVAQTIAFQGSRGGTDTNVAGVAATIQGSLGTGTGGGGDVLVRTAPKGSTGTTQNTPTDRLVLAAKQVTLTDSTATTVLNVSVASGTVSGGTLWYTIRADDATDFQSLRGRVMWAAVNKGGTVTCGITTPEEVSLTSAGTLTNTVTCVANGNSIDLKLAAISSLTETTLYAYVSTQMDGTGTVTTQ